MVGTRRRLKSASHQADIHFVYMANPYEPGGGSGDSGGGRKSAKSHAARIAHARARRQRMLEYQQEKENERGKAGHTEPPTSNHDDSVHLPNPTLGLEEGKQSREKSHTLVGAQFPRGTNNLASLRKSIFASFGADIKTSEHFLLTYFMRVLVPSGRRHCIRMTTTEVWNSWMYRELMPLAFVSPGLLCAVLLSTCRNLSREQGNPHYAQLATVYKLACFRSLNKILQSETHSVNDATIVQVLYLAADEFAVDDRQASNQHILAAQKMTEMKGGIDKLGMNGFLAALVDTFSHAAQFKECRFEI